MTDSKKYLNTPLKTGEIVTYSLGSLGREISNNCINVFFLVYLNIYVGLNAIVLTVAFVLAKLWDTINDPMLATLINNTKSGKWGRFRPWMAVGALLNTVSLILMFTPLGADASTAGKYFYYIFMYVVWGMTFTMVDVPFWSMIPTIANTTDERNKVSSLSKLVGGFGGFVISSIGTSLILPGFESYEKGYLVLGISAGAMMFCFMSVTILCNREKYEIPNEKVGLKAIFEMFKSNDQLVAYAISYVLFVSATTIALFQILYLFVYCYPNGFNYFSNEFSYTVFTIVACTGQGIAMFFYSLLTKKIPREKIYGANYFMAVVGMAGLFLIFFILQPGNYWLNTVIVALAGAFLMTANGLNQIGSTVMIADVVDYGEWKTGRRGDSVVFSVQTLLTKFAGTIAMLILGIGIEVAGLPKVSERYDTELGKVIQEFVDNNGHVVDFTAGTGALTVLRVFMFLVPIPLCIAGYIVYKKKYDLYGAKYDNIKAEIEQRRLACDASVSDGAGVAAEAIAEAAADAITESAAAEVQTEEKAAEETSDK